MAYWLDVPRCEHLKDDGIRCGSPALRGQPFCYNHDQIHHPRHVMGDPGYQIPVLETQKSVELAIRQVLQAYYERKIDDLRARTMIYGIQVLAPYACRNQQPLASRVATELPPAMQQVMGKVEQVMDQVVEQIVGDVQQVVDQVVEQVVNDVDQVIDDGQQVMDAGRPRPADSPHILTQSCIADIPTRDSRVAATDNSPARSAGEDPPTNLSSPVGTTETPAPSTDIVISIDPAAPGLLQHDPEKVRACWTQHLPPDVVNLCSPSGELIYTPPDWLPLTDDELAYLRDHLDDEENARRMNLHFTHIMVKPPHPEGIRQEWEEAWAIKSPQKVATLLRQALQGKLA